MLAKTNEGHFKVRTSVASDGERWAYIGVGKHCLPHDPTLLFATLCLRERGLSINSQVAYLSALSIMLTWADKRGIDLEERVGTGKFLQRVEIHDLRVYLRGNRNKDKARDVRSRHLVKPTVVALTYVSRLNFVTDYLTWQAEDVIQRVPSRDSARAREMRLKLDTFRKTMLINKPRVRPGERSAGPRSW